MGDIYIFARPGDLSAYLSFYRWPYLATSVWHILLPVLPVKFRLSSLLDYKCAGYVNP